MISRKRLLGTLLPAALIFCMLLIPVQTIEVATRQKEKVIFREKAAPGDVFTFSYIHSIEKIPVEGRFAVEADGWLRVVETRFPSYGAGLPLNVTGKSPDGKWMIAQGGERLPRFSFFISPINSASFCFGDETLDLTNLVRDGDVITVAVKKYSYLLMRLGFK
jgi:hypothetical protein